MAFRFFIPYRSIDARLGDNVVIIAVEGKDIAGLIEEGFEPVIRQLCEKQVFKKMWLGFERSLDV